MKASLAWALATATLFVSNASADDLIHAQGHTFRWGHYAAGHLQTVTYAILTDRYVVPGGRTIISPNNCGSMQGFNTIVEQSPEITTSAARGQLALALATWAAAANIAFVEVDDPKRANIVVGAANTTSGSGRAFANLSYQKGDVQPVVKALGQRDERPVDRTEMDTPVEIEQAYVCLNPTVSWKIGFDGNLTTYDLQHTFTHELGHALGLDHPGKTGAVMAYRYDEASRKLTPADLAAVRSLYGRKY
jgi:hypothetical protein